MLSTNPAPNRRAGLDREKMIDRMLASDAGFDGRFITGVLSTGIYCLPSCRARKPKPENVRFFARPEAAEAAGLRPCKRCRPDLFYRGHDPDRQLVEELTAELRREPGRFRNVKELVAASEMGSSKLTELFRRHYHVTPSEMLCRARIDLCQRELCDSDRAISELAFAAGFESLSAFNTHFRRLCRLSPGDYRRLHGASSFEISLPRWFDRARVLAYLGRDPESLTEHVVGDDGTVRLGLWGGGQPLAVTVEWRGASARCRLAAAAGDAPAIPAGAAVDVHRQVLRLLGLVIDPRPFERRRPRQPVVARLVAGRDGLSIPQTASVFDGLVWVVCGQQVSLPVAFALRRRLAGRAGVLVDEDVEGGDRGLYTPPLAAAVAALQLEELRGLGFSRAKADYLSGIADAVTAGSLTPAHLRELSATRLEETLVAIRGLGPWSVNYLMMRSFGLVDCVPVGDVALERNLQRFFDLDERPKSNRTRELMQPFSPHRSLATFHLWALSS